MHRIYHITRKIGEWLFIEIFNLLERILIFRKTNRKYYGRKKATLISDDNDFPCHKRKPEWVKQEIIRLKALMPEAGCRLLAHTFNRFHQTQRQMSVGKTYVSNVLQQHQYDIQVLRRKQKHRKPRIFPRHLIWGMDLSYKTDSKGKQHPMLGILEYRSRACLKLQVLKDKSTITLLRKLFDVIEYYPKPKYLRTDNEAVFTSKLFRAVLWLLNIKHQRIEKGCPW